MARAIDDMLNWPSDVVARYGGEEFVVILPYIENNNAPMLAEQIRSHIELMRVRGDGKKFSVTISIGVATRQPDDDMDPKELIAEADAALYRAKRDGRNRIIGAD